MMDLIGEIGLPSDAIDEIVHGTTVAINAVLEGKGAKTTLITTKGFRDILELRRHRAPLLYSMHYEPPPPLRAEAPTASGR